MLVGLDAGDAGFTSISAFAEAAAALFKVAAATSVIVSATGEFNTDSRTFCHCSHAAANCCLLALSSAGTAGAGADVSETTLSADDEPAEAAAANASPFGWATAYLLTASVFPTSCAWAISATASTKGATTGISAGTADSVGFVSSAFAAPISWAFTSSIFAS